MPNVHTKKTFVIIDSNAVIHRSYHALPPLTSPKGELVNAVYGYASLLLKVLRELKPDYVAAAFDLAGPTFRHKAYKAYKATRAKAPDELYAQIPLVKKMLEAFGIPVLEKQGFEADDVIGTVAKKLSETKGISCIIVTGDLDTLQLVNEGTRVYTLKSGLKEAFIYNENEIQKRFGIGSSKLKDFKGLKGDLSDNIPGVPGIGEKTASALLQEFETLEKLYVFLEANVKKESSGKSADAAKRKKTARETVWKKPLTQNLAKLLLEYRDQAFFSRELSTINCDVPLEFLLENTSRAQYERSRVVELFREFGFVSLVERLDHIGDEEAREDAGSASTQSATSVKKSAEPLDEEFLKKIQKKNNGVLGVSLITDMLLGVSLPRLLVLGMGDDVRYFNFKESLKKFPALVRTLEDPAIPKYCHGAKSLWHALRKEGVTFRGFVFDTEIAYLLTRSNARDSSFAMTVLQELGAEHRISGDDAHESWRLHEYLGRLKGVLEEKITKQGLGKVFYEIEMPLIGILAEMEERGICVDIERAQKLAGRFAGELAGLEKDIHKLAGADFNVNSTKELREVLFEKMQIGIKGIRKTAGGAISTQASELEKLKSAHPIVPKILSYREFFKIKTTYLDTLPGLVDKKDRVHTTYMQLGASTGRLSSQDPNMQNIPIRGAFGNEIRSMFTAGKGRSLFVADYSQLELRIVSHLSGDPVMRDAFLRGEDIHTRTASLIFGTKPDKVTKDMRMHAKTLNFGVLYGMGPQAFSETAGVDFEKAKEFIAGYFREFAGLKGYLDAMKAEAQARGYVETLFGRRRYIPEIRSTNFAVRRAGERMAINMPVQGTAADIVKMAMIHIEKRLKKEMLDDGAHLLLQVHDELVFEVRDGILDVASKIVREEMERVATLNVPLIAECRAGKSWGETKSVA